MQKLSDLPPTIELLLTEGTHQLDSPEALKKFLDKGFLKELRSQAEFTLNKWAYFDRQEEILGDLAVVPTGALNPFSTSQKCSTLECRIDVGRAFARTVGLYSEYAIVQDVFTALVLHGDAEHISRNLFCELAVLAELLPLARQGIVRFGRPGMFLCAEHSHERETLVEKAVKSLLESVAKSFQIELSEGRNFDLFRVTNPLLQDPAQRVGTMLPFTKSESRQLLRGYRRRKGGRLPSTATQMLLPHIEAAFYWPVWQLFCELNLAGRAHAHLTTGSRMDAQLLRYANEPLAMREVENWEKLRSIQLPWIRDLSPENVIRLRESAAPALGRLRAVLSSRLTTSDSQAADGVVIAHELEAEAAEIQAEIEAWKGARGRQFETAFGSLGISLIIYGFAHDLILAAGAAVLSAVPSAYRELKTEKVEVSKLKSRPGFVLLRARELLRHRAH